MHYSANITPSRYQARTCYLEVDAFRGLKVGRVPILPGRVKQDDNADAGWRLKYSFKSPELGFSTDEGKITDAGVEFRLPVVSNTRPGVDAELLLRASGVELKGYRFKSEYSRRRRWLSGSEVNCDASRT